MTNKKYQSKDNTGGWGSQRRKHAQLDRKKKVEG
jgi:hypothetical protein